MPSRYFRVPLSEIGYVRMIVDAFARGDRATLRALGIRYRPVAQTLREAILAARGAGLLDDEQIGKLASSRSRRPKSPPS